MKKIAIWTLPLAATLALTGCSGLLGSDSAESPTPSPSATVEASASATAAQQPSASPTPEASATTPAATETTSDSGFSSTSESSSASATADAGSNHSASEDQLTAQELLEVAQSLESYYEKGGVKIIKNAELKASADQSKELIASMKVSPAECGVYASSGSMDLMSHMNMVSVSIPRSSNDAGMVVSIGSFDDASDIASAESMAESSSKDCSEFTMTMGGQEITAAVETGKANTKAEKTIATMAEINMAGQKTRTLSVSGYDGVNNIGVAIVSPKDADVAVAQAEEYLDLALLHMAGY